MLRIIVVISVVFLAVGCGKFRHSYMSWPARLVSVSEFPEQQADSIYSIIGEFNQHAGKNLIITDDMETKSSVYIKWTPEIPKNALTIAGRAILQDNVCTILISSLISSKDAFLKPVLWHELGHCAGLDHSPNKGELMYKETSPYEEFSIESLDRFFLEINTSIEYF